MNIHYHTTRFGWRDGNDAELLCDGEIFFPRMLQAIDQAEQEVLLEMYLFESGQVADRFISSLCRAAQRGAQVYLLLDDFGCHALKTADRDHLRRAGVRLHFYNPLHYGRLRRALFRDHRKLLLVDGALAFVGGAGIADEFDALVHGKLAWRETMLALRGPCLQDWRQLFIEAWRQCSGDISLANDFVVQTFADRFQGRVSPSSGQYGQEIKQTLMKRLRAAERRVWIATAYFVPSVKLRRALARAARRGVDVRLLLPGPQTDHPSVRHAGRRFYYSLLRAGVRIFEYQPRFTHAKVQMCDAWVSIGSSNIDRWNFRWNLEANQELEDESFARQVAEMFERDFAASRQISLEHWLRRPWYRRWLERFWGRIDVWLDRWMHRP
ncbi:MAG: phospholipase D-like domain-containing protein [Gammaproteobacteria bacterium]|nr:phospholipase D-like domain-containing protein [Gammaproteobacteria bacterium]